MVGLGTARQEGAAALGMAGQGMARLGSVRQRMVGPLASASGYQFSNSTEGVRKTVINKSEVNATVKAALEEVRLAHDGKLRPPDVVEAAKPEEAPLHKYFTWDDSEAAVQYRLHEARQLIRTVVVIVDDYTMPQYVNVPAPQKVESYYTPVDVIATKPDELRLALDSARERLKAASKAFDDLQYILAKAEGNTANIEALRDARAGLATATEAIKKIQ